MKISEIKAQLKVAAAAPIEKNGVSYGSLGLIGPMRIDYAKFIPYLEYFADRITRMIAKEDDDDET